MMKRTLAAIARDRRCQALMALVRKGRDRISASSCAMRKTTPPPPAEPKRPDNIFLDI